MACVCAHQYPHAPCGCSEDCWQHCPTPDHIRSIRDENARLRMGMAQIQAEADCTSAGPGRDAQRASPYGREAWFEMALDRISAWADDALTPAPDQGRRVWSTP